LAPSLRGAQACPGQCNSNLKGCHCAAASCCCRNRGCMSCPANNNVWVPTAIIQQFWNPVGPWAYNVALLPLFLPPCMLPLFRSLLPAKLQAASTGTSWDEPPFTSCCCCCCWRWECKVEGSGPLPLLLRRALLQQPEVQLGRAQLPRLQPLPPTGSRSLCAS